MADGGKPPSSSFPRPPLSSSSPFPNPNSNTTAATPSTIPPSSSSLTPSTAPRGGFAIGVPANRPSQPFATFGPSPPPSSSLHHGRGVNQGMHNIGNSFGSQPQRLAQTPIRQTPPPFSTPSFNPQRMGTPSSSLTQHHMHATIPSYKPSQLQQQQQQRPIQTPSQIQQQQQRPLQTPSQIQQQRPIQTPSQIQQQQQRPIQTPSQIQQQQMRPIQQQMRPYQTPLSHLQMTPMNNMNVNPNRVPISGPIGPIGPLVNEEEEGDRILSKRTIHELFAQIDPSEKVEADVEDVLIEVAEDFVESLTTFACSLAKHRKSSTLEAKDILLHAERNWNITLPGFSGDDVKMYKKQNVNDIHRERLALIKKSMGDPRRANYLAAPPGAQNKP